MDITAIEIIKKQSTMGGFQDFDIRQSKLLNLKGYAYTALSKFNFTSLFLFHDTMHYYLSNIPSSCPVI